MKSSKLTAAIIAAATAFSPLTMYSPDVLTTATVYAEDSASLAELPDWIPTDHGSALEFRNTYGAIHISNGLICVVYPERVQYGKSDDTYGLELKPTEKMGQLLKQTVYTSDECETCFDVFVYQPLKQGELTLTLADPHVQVKETDENWQPPTIAEYTFTTDKNLNITETDIYSWLPDSAEEYRAFRSANPYEPAVFMDNYVLFLLSDGIGTAYEWTVNDTGSECFELEAVSNCSLFNPTPVEGGASNKIYAYKAVKDGYDTISYDLKAVYSDNAVVETIKADCAVYDDAQHVLLGGQMKVTLVDYDTGKPLELTPDINASISTLITINDDLLGSDSTGPILPLMTNPSIHESIGGFFDSDTFILQLDLSSLPDGYSAPDNADQMAYYSGYVIPSNSILTRRFNNGSVDAVFRLKYTADGDVNGDNEFSVSDIVSVQNCILGRSGLKNWKHADFCVNDKLDVFDLIAMKRELFIKQNYVKPDEYYKYGPTLFVIEDGLKMYTGPGEDYDCIDELPADTYIEELGSQKGNEEWLLTKYNGRFGWIRRVKEDGTTPTVEFLGLPEKPVIYLYPEKETDVHVELDLKECELNTTYPRYNNGWDVTAYPDGTLLNKADGTHHKYLFWDGKNCRTVYDFSKGFCVAGNDVESFLKEKLTEMGMTEQEMNEFIVYWLPRMEHNAYNLISFQGEKYTDTAVLNITPAPDSELRVFMTFVPLEEAVEIAPQQFETFERNGFTVVEWGGCELKAR